MIGPSSIYLFKVLIYGSVMKCFIWLSNKIRLISAVVVNAIQIKLSPGFSGFFLCLLFSWILKSLLKSHQMTTFFIQNDDWEQNDVILVTFSSFWTNKSCLWWQLDDDLRTREKNPIHFGPYPLLISSGFLKYPFRHSFQTGIKIQL